MKIFLILLSITLLPVCAWGTVNPCPDILGVYFDETADLNCTSVQFGNPFVVYVVLTNPSLDDVVAVEFSYEVSVGNPNSILRLAEVLPPGVINVGDSTDWSSGDFIMGWGSPAPGNGQSLTLVTWQFVLFDQASVDFYLFPSHPQTLPDGYPAYSNLQDEVKPLGYPNGEGFFLDIPVATVNGDCVLPATMTINTVPDGLNQPWQLEIPGSPNLMSGTGDTTLEGMPRGGYTLTWGDVPGWITPTPNPVTQYVSPGGSVSFDGVYQAELVDIDDVQEYLPDGTPNSPYAGSTVHLRGTVFVPAGVFNPGTYYIQDATGGIKFFNDALSFVPQVGDVLDITGPVTTFSGEIQLQDPGVQFHSYGVEPTPRDLTPDEVLADYENVGMFTRVVGTVASKSINQFELAASGTGNLVVFIDPDTGIDLSAVEVGDKYLVLGPVVVYNGTIEMKPRFPTDVVEFHNWPSDTDWVPLSDPATNDLIVDEGGDGFAPVYDVLGTAAHPLAYYAANDSTYFYRIRLAESPLQESDRFHPLVAKVLFGFDVAQEPQSWDFAIVFEGRGNEVTLQLNPVAGAQWCLDAEEVNAQGYPAGPDLTGHARVVDAQTVVDGLDTWFLDIQVPVADVLQSVGLPLNAAVRVVIGTSTIYNLINRDTANLNCSDPWHDPVSALPEIQPIRWSLGQNAPNPFNPQTTIAFDIQKPAAVSLRVFNLSGGLVRTLIDGAVFAQGRHEAVWNGRDDSGRGVASGSYFYRIEAGEFAQTRRMVLVK